MSPEDDPFATEADARLARLPADLLPAPARAVARRQLALLLRALDALARRESGNDAAATREAPPDAS